MMRNLLLALTAVGIVVWSTRADAYGGLDSYELSPDEVAVLPEFCRHTQLIISRHGSATQQQAWVERTGASFLHMHHYCIAVVALVRSHRHNNTRTDRVGYLQFAVGNLLYVVRNSPPDYVFMPDVFFRLGQAQSRMGRHKEAMDALEETLNRSPGHARAAHELAMVYQSLGDRVKATAVIKSALEHQPDSKLLKAALADLSVRPSEKRNGVTRRAPDGD